MCHSSPMSVDVYRENIMSAAEAFFISKLKAQTPFEAGKTYIPASGKTLDFEDLKYLLHASLDLWLTAGPYTKKFENLLAAFIGGKIPALFVNSGSSANLLALSSFVKAGDEVITAASGFPTTVNPIIQNGGIPVFVDVDYRTLNVQPETIFHARTSKTRGVILSHSLGNCFRADKISNWCAENNLFLIEDVCDALGAKIGSRNVGSFGDFSTFSFYPAHHMTTGEGGAVIAKTKELRRKAECLRDWGRDCWCEPGRDNTCGKRFEWKLGDLPEGYDHKYIYSEIGYNLKATDLQAALGLGQLQKVPQFLKKRQENYDFLFDGICSSPILKENFSTIGVTPETTPSWFGFGLHCNSRIDRLKVIKSLEAGKIGTRLVFAGNLIKHPAYKNINYRISENLNNTDKIMNTTFWVGIHPSLGKAELSYILEKLEDASK